MLPYESRIRCLANFTVGLYMSGMHLEHIIARRGQLFLFLVTMLVLEDPGSKFRDYHNHQNS